MARQFPDFFEISLLDVILFPVKIFDRAECVMQLIRFCRAFSFDTKSLKDGFAVLFRVSRDSFAVYGVNHLLGNGAHWHLLILA